MLSPCEFVDLVNQCIVIIAVPMRRVSVVSLWSIGRFIGYESTAKQKTATAVKPCAGFIVQPLRHSTETTGAIDIDCM